MKNSEFSKYSHINHWSNQLEFKRDYKYLEFFFWEACKNLTKSLNEFHNLRLSTKEWSIILFPWLYEYVSVIYDRWLTVSNHNKNEKNSYKNQSFFYLKKSGDFFYQSQDFGLE